MGLFLFTVCEIILRKWKYLILRGEECNYWGMEKGFWEFSPRFV